MAMLKSARYAVKRFPGVAFYFAGYPQRWEPYTYFDTDPETGAEVECESDEGEWVDDDNGRCLMVMVGDDQKYEVDERDCTEIDDDAYCHECGQIGCTHDGRDRSESEGA